MVPPRTLLMTADSVGGVFTYATGICQSLIPHKVRVILVTMGAPLSPWQRRQIQKLDHVSLIETEYRLEWMPDPWKDVDAAGELLLSIESECAVDAVHLNGYAHASLPWRTPPLVVGHSCVLSWWEAVKGRPAPPEWDLYRKRVTEGIQKAGWLVAPSAAMLSALKRHFGPLPCSLVIPNSIEARPQGPAEKAPFILSAGRFWDEAKNVSLLREVAPLLQWPTYVAGSGCEDGHDDDQFRSLGQLAREEMGRWMARAEIYAAPALYEPFGLAILEAAHAGCALVLADIPSLRENWDGAALFSDPRSPAEFTDHLQRLIASPQERRALQAAARQRAATFDSKRMAEAYVKLYSGSLADRSLRKTRAHRRPAGAVSQSTAEVSKKSTWISRVDRY